MNFYTPLYLNEDFDRDGLPDLVTIHGGDPTRKPRLLLTVVRMSIIVIDLDENVRLAGEILLVSTRTGRILNVTLVPDQMESYDSPQLIRRSPTEDYILIGTGGETHAGGLYAFDFRCWRRSCASPVNR
jgi:hypothetical protein